MDAQLLLFGFVKDGDFYYPTTTQQEFRLKVDLTLRPAWFSLFVPWGERNGKKLWRRITETSSINKIKSCISSNDAPPGALCIRGELQPYYKL